MSILRTATLVLVALAPLAIDMKTPRRARSSGAKVIRVTSSAASPRAASAAHGQITAGGATHLENREAAINQSRQADLAANGGRLTGAEARNLNRREGRVSTAARAACPPPSTATNTTTSRSRG